MEFLSEGTFSDMMEGEFKTTSFAKVGNEYELKFDKGAFRIGFEKLPTHQDNEFWNHPDLYENVFYPDFPNSMTLKGPYYEYQSQSNQVEQCWLM